VEKKSYFNHILKHTNISFHPSKLIMFDKLYQKSTEEKVTLNIGISYRVTEN